MAGRAREEGDGREQCGQCGAVEGRPGVMLRRAVLLATPRASTRERPDAERTDSAASPRRPSLVVVGVVDRAEAAAFIAGTALQSKLQTPLHGLHLLTRVFTDFTCSHRRVLV